MTNKTQLIGAVILFACIAASPNQQVRKYSVNHTEGEWSQFISGEQSVRDAIHRSDLPANVAFYCDSILTAHQNDIYSQVVPAIKADTTQKKKP